MPLALDLGDVARLVTETFGAAPAATVSAVRSGIRGEGAAGHLEAGGPGGAASVTPSTPFDLASVTKPIVALTLARLVRKKRISLDEPLGIVVPALSGTFAGGVPIELFAAHRSGLAAHIELFAPLRDKQTIDREEAIARAANSRRPECAFDLPPEGYPPIYSDMGFLLLGLVLETREGAPLDAIIQKETLEPLGLATRIGSARQLRAIAPDFDRRVAPTEVVPFRGGVVRGVVHDENAWALYGDAAAGHAGLFGDAGGVLAVGEAVMRACSIDDGWLGPADLAPLLRPRPGGTLLAGFDGKSAENPSSGAYLGPKTFGHLGFTGTSLWIDPESAFVGVLLTNRVHPTRDHIAIRKARPAAYDAMFTSLR